MATDAQLTVQASVTKTATFNGAGVDLGTMTPAYGLVMRVLYSAATNASGSNTVTFSVDTSDDNSSWNSAEFQDVADAIALSTTAQSGEQFIAFRTKHRYVRLTCTISGSGSTPTVTYQGDIVQGIPA